MKYLLGFVAGLILSAVTGEANDYWQAQQQLNALRQMQQFQQQQYNEQFMRDQRERWQVRPPC